MSVLPSAASPSRIGGTRVPSYVFETPGDLARHVAQSIAALIRERNAQGQSAVIALPAGSTPTGIYRELVRLHRDEQLDFSRVIVFALDELHGLGLDQPQSHGAILRQQLLRHVNIPAENVFLIDGLTPVEQVAEYAQQVEAAIARAGGLDLALLGIGRNGHVGYNEPYTSRGSRTRIASLDPSTRKAAASDFFGEEHVPTQAITLGLGTLLAARKLLLVALGEHKAKVVRSLLEDAPSDKLPASHVQDHSDATVLVDSAAGQLLKARATPWLVGPLCWNDPLIKRAVLWLCEQTGKACLKLSDDDFRDHGLHQLVRKHGPAEVLARSVFDWMMATIEHHPAGRAADPAGGRKRVICFSPHPDDDVISMGGTLIRLNEDGHEVHVAYMTSGNIAVFDHDAHRVADFVAEYNRLFGLETDKSLQLESAVLNSLTHKKPGEPDIDNVRRIKGLIRWSEAKFGAFVVGCKEEHLHNLQLPFYETGTVSKNPVGPDDVRILRELIERVDPHQIYVAGDLSDPHGTHRVCAEAIFRALQEIEAARGSRPEVLLYRGAWQEYDLHEIEIAVPLSPSDLRRKRKAIFMHESQKDDALFPGTDPRQFWQRAEDRNQGTADRYNRIGLPEFYALEAFVRWNGIPI
ncbi:MAG: 6-phosphogluconolactonase [Pirellulales bacterium]